jgi:hypothetical protein
MARLPDDCFAGRDGASGHLIRRLTPRQRTFIRGVRNDTLPLHQMLRKLNIDQKWLTFWLRNRTFRLTLGKALAERSRTYDVENSLNAGVASRQIGKFVLDKDPQVAIRACLAAFEIEKLTQEIKTEKKRCRGVRIKHTPEQLAQKKSGQRRMNGPLVGKGSPVHPMWTEEEAEQMLAELEAPDEPEESLAGADPS